MKTEIALEKGETINFLGRTKTEDVSWKDTNSREVEASRIRCDQTNDGRGQGSHRGRASYCGAHHGFAEDRVGQNNENQCGHGFRPGQPGRKS
eukprot:212250-Heterocapsa_arctica.AAC.1